MTPDRRQALEQVGFTVGSVDQFLGSIQTGAAMTETTTGEIKVVDPKVRVIANTQVVDYQMNEFIMDTYEEYCNPYSKDAESDGDALAEFSGRLCYMSHKTKRPGGNKTYLEHIKESGHGCYDAETEVLTMSGWKKWPDVTMDDKLATMDPATGIIVYRNPIRLVQYEHKGIMYRVDSQHVDLLVTPNHKMYVCQTTTKEGRKKENYQLVPACKLGHVSHAYMKNCNGSASGWWRDCPARDEMALLGFAIGDGTMQPESLCTVKFHLRRERKITWLMSVVRRIEHLGYSIKIGADDRYTVKLAGDRLLMHLFSGIYDENREKQIPWSDSVFTGANREALEGLYDGLIQSDGSISETAIVYDTTSQRLAGQFQQLCLHIGLSANIAYTYDKEQRKSSFGDKPLTRLHVNRRCNRPEVNKWSGCDGKTSWLAHWEGEVFCAEVEHNLLYVRRNGKPVWSGNSVLEHANFSLLFTGVSRSLTHELVRHRAGMAYSMLSQRYVDESVAEYVEPDIIRNDPELHEIWLKAVQHAHEAYVNLADRLTEKLKRPDIAKVCKETKACEECDGTGYLLGHTDGDEACPGCLGTGRWDFTTFVPAGCPKCDKTLVDWDIDIDGKFVPATACIDYDGGKCDYAKPLMTGTERRKAARQAARSVLPNATETKIVVTGNARAWRHFLEQRGSRHAESEIRKLANLVLAKLQGAAPNLFSDYVMDPLDDGTSEINTKYRKV